MSDIVLVVEDIYEQKRCDSRLHSYENLEGILTIKYVILVECD